MKSHAMRDKGNSMTSIKRTGIAFLLLTLLACTGCPKNTPAPEASPASIKRDILKTAHKAEVSLNAVFDSIENARTAGLIKEGPERSAIKVIQDANTKVKAVNAKADQINPLAFTSTDRDALVKDWNEILNLLDDPALLEVAGVKNPQSKETIGGLIKAVKGLGAEITDTLKRLEVK